MTRGTKAFTTVLVPCEVDTPLSPTVGPLS